MAETCPFHQKPSQLEQDNKTEYLVGRPSALLKTTREFYIQKLGGLYEPRLQKLLEIISQTIQQNSQIDSDRRERILQTIQNHLTVYKWNTHTLRKSFTGENFVTQVRNVCSELAKVSDIKPIIEFCVTNWQDYLDVQFDPDFKSRIDKNTQDLITLIKQTHGPLRRESTEMIRQTVDILIKNFLSQAESFQVTQLVENLYVVFFSRLFPDTDFPHFPEMVKTFTYGAGIADTAQFIEMSRQYQSDREDFELMIEMIKNPLVTLELIQELYSEVGVLASKLEEILVKENNTNAAAVFEQLSFASPNSILTQPANYCTATAQVKTLFRYIFQNFTITGSETLTRTTPLSPNPLPEV